MKDDGSGGRVKAAVKSSPDPFPRNLPLSLSLSDGLISQFLSSTCTEVSGVENIGQCGRLSQLGWLLGAL